MTKRSGHPRRLPPLLEPVLVGGLIALAACWLGVSTPAWLQFLHYRVFDVITAPGNAASPSGLPVIVDIDERSLKAHGRWPWPRHRVAELLERLQASEPLAIALDMVFPEPEVADALGVAGSDGDRRLAAALSAGPAVLGFQFEFEEACEEGACLGRPLALPVGTGRDAGLIRACGAVCSLPGLADAARAAGFFNVSPDADGLLRSVPLVIEHGGRLYPSLALAAWLQAAGASPPTALVRDAGDIRLRAGSARIPLEAGGRLRLNFRGPGRTYPYVSADDVLTGRLAPERLRGRIVFVGTSAAGLKEYRSTPTDPLFPGVEVHATVVDNIVTADHPVRPACAPALELSAALLTGVVTILLFRRGRALRLLTALALGAGILWGGAVWAFAAGRVLVSPVLPLLVLVAEFSGLSLLRFWSEERRARERARELVLAQEAIIECMASLTETRDPETGGHIQRTQHYVRILARALGRTGQGGAALSDEAIDLLYKSAPLHDIGKVGVPDRILLKPGRLDADEFEIMKQHTLYGHDAIRTAMRKLANGSFLQTACDIAIAHHERWDGRGYPRGLRGEEIPLAGRLMALADTYDALISRRVYKPPMTHDAAVDIILESSGSQFDPALVQTFLAVAEEFRRVAREYADSVEDEKVPGTPPQAVRVPARVAPRGGCGTASPA